MSREPTGRPECRGGKRLVTRKEAMFRLGIGRQKWNDLARAKRIPISRVGGRVFIRSDLLDDLIEHPEKLNVSSDANDDEQK